MKKILISFFLFFAIAVSNGANTVDSVRTNGKMTFNITPSYYFPTQAVYVAIWINNDNPNPNFIRTLFLGATNSTLYSKLQGWNYYSKGVVNDAKQEYATLYSNSNSKISCEWRSSDQFTISNALPAPDRTYRIYVEIISTDGQIHYIGYFSFVKGTNVVNLSSVNSTVNLFLTQADNNGGGGSIATKDIKNYFKDVSIVWSPYNTAVNDVKLETLYSVYPNPAVSSINISGEDVKSVDVCSILGQSLLYSKEKQVNISSLPKGNYLVRIITNNGAVVKKIQKM